MTSLRQRRPAASTPALLLWSLLLAACLLLSGCGKKEEAPPAPAQPATAAPPAEALYQTHCASCHGPEGAGGEVGPSLKKAEYVYGRTPEAVRLSIREGRPNGMPPFGQQLSEPEIGALVDYVLSLK